MKKLISHNIKEWSGDMSQPQPITVSCWKCGLSVVRGDRATNETFLKNTAWAEPIYGLVALGTPRSKPFTPQTRRPTSYRRSAGRREEDPNLRSSIQSSPLVTQKLELWPIQQATNEHLL